MTETQRTKVLKALEDELAKFVKFIDKMFERTMPKADNKE